MRVEKIVMLCRCRSARTVLFVAQKDNLYALPEIRVRPQENALHAVGMFIADHFGVKPSTFGIAVDETDIRNVIRSFGLPDGSSVQAIFCQVGGQVNALAELGAEPLEFRWVGRMECQQDDMFGEETLAILQRQDIQQLLFGLVPSL